ncbi:O-antigen ligase family protein [Streptomyces sp. NBC_01136]|uniref:O-antigen ligase family protein n=1 Tax=unclassified Streptomyces TaxID=2593676 RepID=UPI00324B95EA|nr:O-antigen ligase family protein [Streptomyces sp. NBC_01136]
MRSLSTVVTSWVCIAAAGPVTVYLVLFHDAAAAAAAAVCFALLVWPRPDLALLMLLGLIPVVAVVDPGGTTLPAMVMGAVALLLFRIALNGLHLRVDLALIMLTAFAVTASYLLPQEQLSIEQPWKACALLLVGLGLLVASILAPPDPRHIVRVVAGSGAGVAVSLIVQGEYAADRLTGLGLNPNYVGAMLALSLVAAVGLVRLNRSWVWLLPALVCAAALLETRSRGAFLAAAAGLASVLLAGRLLRHKVLIALAILVAALVLPGTLDSVENDLTGSRTSTELTANTEVRKQAALLAVRVALDHPFRGIGYGMFPDYARTSSILGIYINTHNDYLRLAAEAGIVALVLFVALLWLGLARRYAADHAILQSLGVAYSVGLLFANTLTDLLVSAPFWVSLGCLLAHSSHRKTVPSPVALPHVRKAE